MKTIISILLLFSTMLSVSCKSKKETSSTSQEKTQQTMIGEYQGIVSHKYRKDGCATVVIIKGESEDITLIPINKLSADIDVDGMKILCNYTTLRMPQPDGCSVGLPAELTNISKK